MKLEFMNTTAAPVSAMQGVNYGLFGPSFAALPELMRPSVLAPAIDTTEQRLARERVEGTGIPFVRWGRSIYYSKTAVLEFFSARVRRSTSSESSAFEQHAA